MADFWKIVEVNTGICVPKYLKNILTLNGYDDASSIKSITMEDIDSIEEFVKSGIDEYIGDGEAKDFYHIFHNRKDQFTIMKGDRVKLMDVVDFVRHKWASEGGYKFFQQTLKPTSSESLHSQELPDILFINVDNNQPMKTESNLNDRKLLVSSTTGVLENSHDNAIIAESLPTKQNQITSFSSEDRSDDKVDDILLVPLRYRTPSPSPMIFWSNENVKVEVEADTKDDVDFINDCESTTTTTSHLSKENQFVVLSPNLRRCQEKTSQSTQICNSSRGNKPTLMRKVKKRLKIAPTADVDRESNIDDRMLKDENSTIKRFCCDICGKSFTTKCRIQQHMKFHKGARQHNCRVCGYAYSVRSELQRHLIIHTGEKPYVCDVCPKAFVFSSNLSKHRRIHTGEKPFVCEVCNKEFSQSSNLSKHKRTHIVERYVCDVCLKTFSHSASLSSHKKIHTGETLFVCDVCPKSFRWSSKLASHKRVHSSDKEFVCDVCDKEFSHSTNLSKHKRIHTGEKPFACDVCRKAFRCSSTLKVHKRIHTGEKPFVCDVCPKAFTNFSGLKHHKKTNCGV